MSEAYAMVGSIAAMSKAVERIRNIALNASKRFR
jgi:hypothetical protein